MINTQSTSGEVNLNFKKCMSELKNYSASIPIYTSITIKLIRHFSTRKFFEQILPTSIREFQKVLQLHFIMF